MWMKRILICAAAIIMAGGNVAIAQSLDDLNIQIHGYATQGFLYTTQNNFLTMTTSNGSPNWTEAVVNLGSSPASGLRIGVQLRYELLGNYSNQIVLDWAAADYKVAESFGVRFGKVKIPSGLFNEIQDIDPSYMWGLLPQSVYPISSRTGQLATFGGVAYGTVSLPAHLGKIDYRGWSGDVTLPPNDGYFLSFKEEGIVFANGLSSVQTGGALHWRTPLPGLMIGASDTRKNKETGAITAGGAIPGNFIVSPFNQPDYFAKYEKNKWLLAAEWTRLPLNYKIQFAGPAAPATPIDFRGLYGMVTYKVTDKLTAGVYDSQYFDHASPLGPERYSKDWVISGRYDLNQYLYAKAEEHFIQGEAIGYDTALNPNGLQPNTKLTLLKVGVSF
jgi:hypothetical protein